MENQKDLSLAAPSGMRLNADLEELLNFFSNIDYLETIKGTLEGDHKDSVIELYPSETLLEGKLGYIARVALELKDRDRDHQMDTIVFTAWYEVGSEEASVSIRSMNEASFLDDDYSRYVSPSISNDYPAINRVLYIPEGLPYWHVHQAPSKSRNPLFYINPAACAQ